MHDIKYIRSNPQEFDKHLARRGLKPMSAKILEIDSKRRGGITDEQKLKEEINSNSKKIGLLMAQGSKEEAQELISTTTILKSRFAEIKMFSNSEVENTELNELLATIPNILDGSVPQGKDENDNVEVRKVGQPKKFSFNPKAHFDIGEDLGVMDFERTAKISGSRFASIFGDLARLERALAAFMIDAATKEFDYLEASVPYLVKPEAAFGTGQLPKFEIDLFKTTNDYYLVPTSEVPLTNLVRESILEEKQLPLRYTAFTPCFRSEAGSAGKDTRGYIRMHQFSKVELVSITTPELSMQELERKTSCAETVLVKLGLPFRTVSLCSADVGFGSSKTYDIEVWLPAQNTYREISSCSNMTAFQARRMNARFRRNDGKIDFVHTLNGSSLAVGRTIVAILENYQQADGSVVIPDVLVSYMGGIRKIDKLK